MENEYWFTRTNNNFMDISKKKLIHPVDVWLHPVSQWFGPASSPRTQKWYEDMGMKGHNGIDYTCKVGTLVKAAHAGVVDKVYTSSTGGKGIWLWDKKQNIKTLYFHLSEQLVKKGKTVKAGDIIAKSGNTGKYTTGPHLHFGVYLVPADKDNGYKGAIDPEPLLAEKFETGTLIKNAIEPKVFLIQNIHKWWIYDEETFYKWFGYKVSKADIKVVDLVTYNYYSWGGIIGKKG